MPSISLNGEYIGHTGAVYALCEGLHPNQFYSTGGDGNLVEWTLGNPNGKLIATIGDAAYAICYDRTHRCIYVGTQNGYVIRIPIDFPAESRKIIFHKNKVSNFLLKDDKLYSVSSDGNFVIWDLSRFEIIKAIYCGPIKLRGIWNFPQEEKIFFGSNKEMLYSYSHKDDKITEILKIPGIKMVFSIVGDDQGKHLWLGGMDARIRVIETEPELEIVNIINAHWYTINAQVVLNDEKLIISASRDRSIRIWNQDKFELLKDVSFGKTGSHHRSVNHLLWNNENKVLISASDDRTIKSWTIRNI